MENQPKDNQSQKPGEEKWRARLARDLAEHIADHKKTWGGIDENLMAAYVSGVCTEEEITRVERAMKDFPAVRECIEATRQDLSEGLAGNSNEKRPGPGSKIWSDRADRHADDPGKSR